MTVELFPAEDRPDDRQDDAKDEDENEFAGVRDDRDESWRLDGERVAASEFAEDEDNLGGKECRVELAWELLGDALIGFLPVFVGEVVNQIHDAATQHEPGVDSGKVEAFANVSGDKAGSGGEDDIGDEAGGGAELEFAGALVVTGESDDGWRHDNDDESEELLTSDVFAKDEAIGNKVNNWGELKENGGGRSLFFSESAVIRDASGGAEYASGKEPGDARAIHVFQAKTDPNHNGGEDVRNTAEKLDGFLIFTFKKHIGNVVIDEAANRITGGIN